jgi:hypothetical protein
MFKNISEANKMNKRIIAIALLLAGMFWSCEDKIVDNELEEGIRVEIVSPNSDEKYSDYIAISFKAFLLNNNDTLLYDKIEWTSDISGSISVRRALEGGKHTIRCTITKDSIDYSSIVNITVSNFVKLDTLFISDNLHTYQIPNINIYTIAVDKNNKAILGSFSGLFYQENNTWKNINYDDGLLGYEIQSIGVSNDNIIHFGYWSDNGITKQQGTSWVNIEMDNSLGGDVHHIAFDSDNNIWAATHSGKIVQYINSSWKIFPDQAISLGHPSALLFDNNGTLFGSSEFGCIKFDGQNWEMLYRHDGLLKAFSFTVDNIGTIWAYHWHRLTKVTETDTIIYSSSELPFLTDFVTEMETDQNNNLWLSTENGLIKFDGTNWARIQMPISDNYFYDLVIDSENKIWFCGKTIFGYYKE